MVAAAPADVIAKRYRGRACTRCVHADLTAEPRCRRAPPGADPSGTLSVSQTREQQQRRAAVVAWCPARTGEVLMATMPGPRVLADVLRSGNLRARLRAGR